MGWWTDIRRWIEARVLDFIFKRYRIKIVAYTQETTDKYHARITWPNEMNEKARLHHMAILYSGVSIEMDKLSGLDVFRR
jgi:hypothetical protein